VDVALVLECGRANGNIVSARKGIADVDVVVHGRAAHAGIEPEKGRHAILEAARIVREVQDLNGRWPGVTFNVGTIRGGTRPNVVPDRCEMEIETRSVTGDGLDAAIAAVGELVARTGIPDTTAEASVGYSWRPMEKTERSARLAEHAKEVGRRLGIEFDDQLTGGASDANTTSGMGVPTLDGLGPVGGNDHAPSEYLEIDSIVPRTAMLAGLLLEIAADPVVLDWRSEAAAPAAGG
jgi:glutamate carboxypeptidase